MEPVNCPIVSRLSKSNRSPLVTVGALRERQETQPYRQEVRPAGAGVGEHGPDGHQQFAKLLVSSVSRGDRFKEISSELVTLFI